jgi:TPP-dependent pyruvate/acetoin dehydrogenase alpha subunit
MEIDGQDVVAVYSAFKNAREHVKSGKGPCFINAITYRYEGHFSTEYKRGFKYRSDDEVDTWRLRDPLLLMKRNFPHLINDFQNLERSLEHLLQECLLEVLDKYDAQGSEAL